MKTWLQDSNIGFYLTHNEGKLFVPERFVRILKKEIRKNMTAVSKMCMFIS